MLISTNTGLYSSRPNEGRVPIAEAVEFLASAGFEAIDVNFSASIYKSEFAHEPILDGDDWRARVLDLKKTIQRCGLTAAHSHAPFGFEYSNLEDPDHELYLTMMYRSIEATAMLEAPYVVVHPALSGDKERTLIPESIDALKPYAAFARRNGVTLAVENMVSTSASEIIKIADALDIVICWDVGHANINGMDQIAALRAIGSRVKTIHLHDNYGLIGKSYGDNNHSDRHNPPFIGNLDWPALLEVLFEIGYDGTFNYEVNASNVPVALHMEHVVYLVEAAKVLLGRKFA